MELSRALELLVEYVNLLLISKTLLLVDDTDKVLEFVEQMFELFVWFVVTLC